MKNEYLNNVNVYPDTECLVSDIIDIADGEKNVTLVAKSEFIMSALTELLSGYVVYPVLLDVDVYDDWNLYKLFITEDFEVIVTSVGNAVDGYDIPNDPDVVLLHCDVPNTYLNILDNDEIDYIMIKTKDEPDMMCERECCPCCGLADVCLHVDEDVNYDYEYDSGNIIINGTANFYL